MSKSFFIAVTALFAVAVATVPVAMAHTVSAPRPVEITVYKDPDCGCCKKWVEHLRKHGYHVTTHDTRDMASVKTNFGVKDKLQSCHTAIVNGYVIEGHVSASDIDRLLKERPKIAGLAVPGMPQGSPGMEGSSKEHYAVFSFDRAGGSKVFARH
jgi:hypothetical protein